MGAPSRFTATIDEVPCTGCEECLGRCYFDAIRFKNDIGHIVPENCLGCGLCVVIF